jgi:hypothetical protein
MMDMGFTVFHFGDWPVSWNRRKGNSHVGLIS